MVVDQPNTRAFFGRPRREPGRNGCISRYNRRGRESANHTRPARVKHKRHPAFITTNAPAEKFKIRKAGSPGAGLGTRVLPRPQVRMPKENAAIVDRPLIQLVVDERARPASRAFRVRHRAQPGRHRGSLRTAISSSM